MVLQRLLRLRTSNIRIAESLDNALDETVRLMRILSLHPFGKLLFQCRLVSDDIPLLEQLPTEVLEERNRLESSQRRVLAFRYHRLVKCCTVPRFECEVVGDGGNARPEEGDRVKESNIVARFMTRQTIDWIGVRIGDVCEFAEVRVAVFVLDK